MIDCIDECPFLTHCPTCGSSRDDDEDTDSTLEVEGHPLCYFCLFPIRPLAKRAFIEAIDTVLIICKDCLYDGVVAGELPPNFLEKLV